MIHSQWIVIQIVIKIMVFSQNEEFNTCIITTSLTYTCSGKESPVFAINKICLTKPVDKI